MKTKSLLLLAFILSVFYTYADTDKYRLILTDDPATTITVAWNQISGSNPTLHYDTVDYGTTYTSYLFSQTADRVMPF